MKRKKRNLRAVKPPLCKCGCGNPTKKTRNGSYNAYIHGHNPKRNGDSRPSKNANSGQFQAGNKHGKGRPQGSRNKVTIAAENVFDSDSTAIARKAVDMALDGHAGMIKLVLERIVPVKRSTPVKLPDMPTVTGIIDASQLTGYVLGAVADGKLSPVDGEIVSRSCERHLRALQVSDLEQRLSELEEKLKG